MIIRSGVFCDGARRYGVGNYREIWRFWSTVFKTVRPILSDRCLSVLSVCDVGVLWANGWTDQDETWHASRPRPRPHCVWWYIFHSAGNFVKMSGMRSEC